MMKKQNTRAQSLAEVLIAVVFLATAGLALYSAQISTVQTTAWAHERLFAQGVVRDLAESLSALKYCDLKRSPFIEACSATEPEESAVQRALGKGDAYQKAFDEDASPLLALKQDSFFVDPDHPKPPAEMAKDPIHASYLQTIKRIALKRVVLFKDDPAMGQAVVVCWVVFKATRGEPKLRHPFVKTADPSENCP